MIAKPASEQAEEAGVARTRCPHSSAPGLLFLAY